MQTQQSYLLLWIKCNNSIDNSVHIYLLKDDDQREVEIQSYIDSVHNHLKGKPYYEHVFDVIAISNCIADESAVNNLRELVVEAAKIQPYWGEERPNRWLLLADKLAQERIIRKEDPILQFKEVINIAKELGVTESEVPTFLKFYHKLGDLIYFDADGVRDTVVLCPQWLANQFR